MKTRRRKCFLKILKKKILPFATTWMSLVCDGHRRILSLLIEVESRMVVAGGVEGGENGGMLSRKYKEKQCEFDHVVSS